MIYKQQFAEGMRKLGLSPSDTRQVCSIFGGGYCRKSDVAKLNEMFTRHRKELEDAIAGDKTGQGFICDMFLQELENHEYSYTGDVQETLDALGITAQYMEAVPQLLDGLALACEKAIEVMDTLYPEDLVMNGYHGFLFRNREGYFLSAHNINRAIQRISIAYNAEEMDQAELEDREPELLPHFSVHNMRHTFCTRLCESTNDIKFIQQVMGHADFSTTMDIYTHITQENMREKAEAIKGNLVLM